MKIYFFWIKIVILSYRNCVFIYFLPFLLITACGSAPETSRRNSGNTEAQIMQQLSGGLAEEIRNLTESGILSSMLQAIELINSRGLSNSEFGRLMTGVNIVLIRLVYPDSLARLPIPDFPQTSNYTRIIREAERGIYTRPPENSTDFLEYILPFLAFSNITENGILMDVLRDLMRANSLKPNSIFPSYFSGLIYERFGRYNEAFNAYRQASRISSECYSAQIGAARVRMITGNPREAVSILSDLVIRYPDSMIIKRELAIAFYSDGNFSRALPAINEILLVEPRDGELLLMRASILIEQGQYAQANVSLDSYAPINQHNRMYLYMRARVQAEGNRNRDAALNYLRSILRSNPDDIEAMIYTATLLMESTRASDQTEGRELLVRLNRLAGSSFEVISLNLKDAVHRESWREAQVFLNQILAVRRTVGDLIDAYYIERGLGNNARALTYARELYDRDNSNHDYTSIYISSLIDNNRRDEASRLLESRFLTAGSGQVRSRYYFLRSRLQTNQEAALNDLRSSLFEDPRNLDAIIAMFEIYHNRREERRAVYYLRQALAIAPDNPRLRRYEIEYAHLLR